MTPGQQGQKEIVAIWEREIPKYSLGRGCCASGWTQHPNLPEVPHPQLLAGGHPRASEPRARSSGNARPRFGTRYVVWEKVIGLQVESTVDQSAAGRNSKTDAPESARLGRTGLGACAEVEFCVQPD